MNPTTEPPLPQLQPPQPPQPHRLSTSCDRHPDEHFTGFCPSCLCERLAVLDPSNSASASTSSRKTSAAAAAIKAIFKPSAAASSSAGPSSFLPELRRTKSFSASKNEGFFSAIFEPQRKSCDVRVRNTLWTLFTLDDETKITQTEARNLASSSVRGPVLESKEEDTETESDKLDIEVGDDEIRVLEEEEEEQQPNVVEDRVQEIIEEDEEEVVEELEQEEPQQQPDLVSEDLKTMKDHIDLDSVPKKPSGRDFKEIAGSFWSAASVFSKKLQKWRRKQKMKKRDNGSIGSATLPVEKPIGRQFRETQSEIADYGFGRRSCDTDPRFSLDAGRISFDDPRFSLDAGRISFDEPRASWDGYLIGRTFPPRMPTMVSVVEDSPPPVPVMRTDTQIPVEEPVQEEFDGGVPGGSAQTRDYYLDSSSRRRKSLDRSNSIRKTAAAVVAEIDELKSGKNAKVSPATMDYCHMPSKLEYSNSLRDDLSETFEIGFRDNGSVLGSSDRKTGSKKSSRWKAWSIWGFIHRRGGNKDDNDDRYSRSNGVERSLSESWQDSRGAFNRKVFRSNSSVSSRNSSSLRMNGNGNVNGNGIMNGKKKRDEFVLERNRSARYSPNNVVDNGLLRFYLTPMRGSRRGGPTVKGSRTSHAQSIARSVLRLY